MFKSSSVLFRAATTRSSLAAARRTFGNNRSYSSATTRSSSSKLFALASVGVATVGAFALFQDEKKKQEINAADKVPHYGVPGTKKERSFIAIKPDGVHRSVIGEIIKRFEAKGYKLVAIKVVVPTKELAEKHYADLSTKPFFPHLVKYFTSGPVVAMVWEGKDVIKGGRALVGATNPQQASPGSVRGDFAVAIGRNLIHGSDGPDSAKDEISLWFKEGEVAEYEHALDKWIHEN